MHFIVPRPVRILTCHPVTRSLKGLRLRRVRHRRACQRLLDSTFPVHRRPATGDARHRRVLRMAGCTGSRHPRKPTPRQDRLLPKRKPRSSFSRRGCTRSDPDKRRHTRYWHHSSAGASLPRPGSNQRSRGCGCSCAPLCRSRKRCGQRDAACSSHQGQDDQGELWLRLC